MAYSRAPRAHSVKSPSLHPTLESLADMAGRLTALGKLPALYGSILTLRHVAGLSIPEIAYVLGISRHTAKKYLFRALERLRR